MPPVTAVSPLPFEPFHAAHRAAVLRLLVGMVGPDDTLDCFQETFLKALRAWPPSEPAGRLDSWVLTIAHRTALDLLRGNASVVSTDEVPEQAAADAIEPALDALDATELWDAVRALAPKQRGAVVLRGVLDRSHSEVAAVLGCSEEAARRSWADGLRTLRRRIDDGDLEVNR
jgi:RNA polymerase sigma factor (sigma-70 family)